MLCFGQVGPVSFRYVWKKDNNVFELIGAKDGVCEGWCLTLTSTGEDEMKVMNVKSRETALAIVAQVVPGIHC